MASIEDRPLDMEWAKDGHDGELYLVQTRPETINRSIEAHPLALLHPDRETGLQVRQGIDSISLNPDTVLKTILHVLDIERRMADERT